MFTLVCHPLEMANKVNDADHILITLQFSSLSKSNAREVTIILCFQSAIERAASPVREIICPFCIHELCVNVLGFHATNVQNGMAFTQPKTTCDPWIGIPSRTSVYKYAYSVNRSRKLRWQSIRFGIRRLHVRSSTAPYQK